MQENQTTPPQTANWERVTGRKSLQMRQLSNMVFEFRKGPHGLVETVDLTSFTMSELNDYALPYYGSLRGLMQEEGAQANLALAQCVYQQLYE